MSGTWVDFTEIHDTGKTKIWQVVTTYDGGGTALGTVRWHGPWRKYAFFPAVYTLFEPTCLRDIAAFIDKVMTERREARKK